MRASIIVPTRGGALRLPGLLGVLECQDHDDVEVVVVVDGDIDNSVRVLSEWHSRLRLTVVEFPENRGRSAALGAGFAAATGAVLIRCDDDLVPGAEFASRHVARHGAAPEPLGVVGLCRNSYPDSPYAAAYGRHADEQFRDTAYRVTATRAWTYWGANVSVTREIYDRVGPYDTTYRTYGWEDVDWGYRLHALGVPVVVAPELETEHRVSSTSTAIRTKRAYLSGAARNTFEGLHGPSAIGVPERPDGVWGNLVRGTSARLDETSLERYSGITDRALPWVPTWVGRKLVALLVESAAIAGYDRPVVSGSDV